MMAQGLPIAALSPFPNSGYGFQIKKHNLSAPPAGGPLTHGRVLLRCATPTLPIPDTPRCSLSPYHSVGHRQKL
jgi:hypothetical protein